MRAAFRCAARVFDVKHASRAQHWNLSFLARHTSDYSAHSSFQVARLKASSTMGEINARSLRFVCPQCSVANKNQSKRISSCLPPTRQISTYSVRRIAMNIIKFGASCLIGGCTGMYLASLIHRKPSANIDRSQPSDHPLVSTSEGVAAVAIACAAILLISRHPSAGRTTVPVASGSLSTPCSRA